MVLRRRLWLMLRLLLLVRVVLLLQRGVLLAVMWSLHAAEMRLLMMLVPLQVLVLYVAARGAWGWRSSPQPSSVALHVVHSFVCLLPFFNSLFYLLSSSPRCVSDLVVCATMRGAEKIDWFSIRFASFVVRSLQPT